jgi:hypothetical protein
LFYEFNLDEVLPAEHLVRRINAVLDLGGVHKELPPHHFHTGRPSIDPALMIRISSSATCLRSATAHLR